MTHRVPTTWKGVLTVLAALAVVLVVIFTATTGGLILGIALIVALWLAGYAMGYRLDRILREKTLLGGDDS